MLRKVVIFLLLVCFLVGCSSQSQEANGHHHDSGTTQAAHAATEEREFSLDAVIREENDKYFLDIETDLTFSEENYGRQHVYGEGHVHFYIGNRLIGPIRNADPYEVTEYVSKNHEDITIRLVLAGNNHREPYGVQKEIVVPAK